MKTENQRRKRRYGYEKAKVYFTKKIDSDSLIVIYEALVRELKDKVAVKISTGEPGGHNFLNPAMIKGLVNKLNGTIVECCTAYEGKRMESFHAIHMVEAAEQLGLGTHEYEIVNLDGYN